MPSHPWTGGGLHESRETDSTSKSALYWLSFVCQMKLLIIFVLSFSNSLDFHFFFLPPSMDRVYPTPWIFHFEISHNIKKYINSPSVFISSLSHAFDPPHSWIFHPTRGFSSTRRVTGSTSMCRDPWRGTSKGRVQQTSQLMQTS